MNPEQFGAFGPTIDLSEPLLTVAKKFGKRIVIHQNCTHGCIGSFKTRYLTRTGAGNIFELAERAKTFSLNPKSLGAEPVTISSSSPLRSGLASLSKNFKISNPLNTPVHSSTPQPSSPWASLSSLPMRLMSASLQPQTPRRLSSATHETVSPYASFISLPKSLTGLSAAQSPGPENLAAPQPVSPLPTFARRQK